MFVNKILNGAIATLLIGVVMDLSAASSSTGTRRMSTVGPASSAAAGSAAPAHYSEVVNELGKYVGDKLLLCGRHKHPADKPDYNSTGWYTVHDDLPDHSPYAAKRNMFPDLIGVLPGADEGEEDTRVSSYLPSKKFSIVFNEFCGPSNKELLGLVSSILKPGGIYYSPFYRSVTEGDLIDAGFTEVIYVPLFGRDPYWIKEAGLTLEGAIQKAREMAVARPEKEKQKFGFLAIK
jgi:hypothetical protein